MLNNLFSKEKPRLAELEENFLQLLRKSPKTKADLEELEKAGLAFETALDEESGPLLDELRSTGIEVTSVWDLVNTAAPYPAAVPVLIRHLSKPYHLRTKEGIVRALAVKEAKEIACVPLLNELENIPRSNQNLIWVFGNTIQYVYTDSAVDRVIAIASDSELGDARTSFIKGLGKSRKREALGALERIALDENEHVRKEATKALAKLFRRFSS